MVGLSYYPALGGTLGQLTTTLDFIATTYRKPVAIVETSYPWRESTDRSTPSMTWPQTGRTKTIPARPSQNAPSGIEWLGHEFKQP